MSAQYHVRQRAVPDAPIPCVSCRPYGVASGTDGLCATCRAIKKIRAEQLYFDVLEAERARKSGGTP